MSGSQPSLREIRWWAGPLLAAVALAFDEADRRIPFGVWTTGLLDEVAHLSTAALGLLVLACFVDTPGRFCVGALIASVAIDVDHIPLYLGLLGNPAQRPLTHSLSAVAVFAAAAAASRRHLGRAGRGDDRAGTPFRARHRRGLPGRAGVLAAPRHFLVGQLPVVPGMIVVFTVARLVLVSVGLPRTRILVFRTPSPSGSIPRSPDGPAASGDRRPGLESHKLFRSDRHE